RQRREIIQTTHPLRWTAANHVTRKRRENVAVAKHDVTRAQQRHQMALVTIRKISGVNQAESGGRQQLPLFTLARRRLDDFPGVPFAEIDLEPLQFQPAFKQINLGGFSRAVQTFDRDESPREIQFGERFHLYAPKAKPALADYNYFSGSGEVNR